MQDSFDQNNPDLRSDNVTGPLESQPYPQPPAPAAAEAAGWTCSCGHTGNTGKFCVACGKPHLMQTPQQAQQPAYQPPPPPPAQAYQQPAQADYQQPAQTQPVYQQQPEQLAQPVYQQPPPQQAQPTDQQFGYQQQPQQPVQPEQQPAYQPPPPPAYQPPPPAYQQPPQPDYQQPAQAQQPEFQQPPPPPVYQQPPQPDFQQQPAQAQQPGFQQPPPPPAYQPPPHPDYQQPAQAQQPGFQQQAQQPTDQQFSFQQPPQQPVQVQPTYSAEPPPKAKSGSKLGLIIGIVAAVVVIGVAVLFFMPRTPVRKAPTDPKEYIIYAMENTFIAMGKEQALQTNLADISAIFKESETKPSRQNFSFGMTGQASMFGNFGMTYQMDIDPAKKQLIYDIAVNMSGFPLGNLAFYLDDDVFSVASPKFFKDEYGVHLKTLGKDYNSSALSRLIGESLDDSLSLTIWPDKPGTMTWQEALDLDGWLKLDANKQLKDKMTITKGSSKSIEVNGFTKTCDVYDMKIGKDALVAYIRAIWNELKKDPAILNAIAMQSPYMTVEDIIDEIESGLDDLKEVFGDLTATFYVMGENLVRVDFVLPVTGYDTVDLKISIQIGGEKNLLDAFSIDVNVDDEGFVLKWAGHHVPVDGKYDTTLTIHTFDYYDPKPVLAFRMKGGYNTNAAENNLSLVFDIMPDSYDEANLIMNGTLTFDKAKKTVKLDLDDIQFDTDYFSQQFTFSYEYMPMNSIDFTKRDVKMIFSLSESELQIIMDEIIENVSQLFGGMLF